MTELYRYIFDWNIIVKLYPEYKQYMSVIVYENDHNGGMQLIHKRKKPALLDDENAIIDLLHNDNHDEIEVNQPQPIYNQQPTNIEYTLQAQYRWRTAIMPTTPLLPPPKQILATGSCFYTSPDTQYAVWSGTERNKDVVKLVQYNIICSKNKIRLITHSYRFDRVKNVVSRMTRYNRLIVYNLKTAKLYTISYRRATAKPKSRYVKIIRQQSLNFESIAMHMHICGTNPMIYRFIEYVKKEVLRKIPNAIVPMKVKDHTNENTPALHFLTNQEINFLALFLQHKVGRQLKWVKDTRFLWYLSQMAKLNWYYNNGPQHEQFKKRLYSIINNLKKNSSAKTVLKTFFGSSYRNLIGRLLASNNKRIDINMMVALCDAIESGKLPKSILHALSRLINEQSSTADRYLVELLSVIENIFFIIGMRAPSERDYDTDEFKKRIHNLTIYAKVVTNHLLKDNQTEIVSWRMFRDTVDMAKRLGIRVRINKLINYDTIKQLHDRLAAYQQRDLEIINKYSNFDFVTFKAPDKEYEGFKFIQLENPDELVDEGKRMHHCVGGYARRCLTGRSVIFTMVNVKTGKHWTTIELDGANPAYPIAQMYTIKNFTVNNKQILTIIEKWKSDIDKLHKNDKTVYNNIANDYYELQKNRLLIRKFQKIVSKHDLPDDEMVCIRKRIEALKQKTVSYRELINEMGV